MTQLSELLRSLRLPSWSRNRVTTPRAVFAQHCVFLRCSDAARTACQSFNEALMRRERCPESDAPPVSQEP